MDWKDSKRTRQPDPDVNVVLHSNPSESKKGAVVLSLKRQQERNSASTFTKKSKTSQSNLIPRCVFYGEYRSEGVLKD